MTLKAFCLTLGLLGLLSGYAIAFGKYHAHSFWLVTIKITQMLNTRHLYADNPDATLTPAHFHGTRFRLPRAFDPKQHRGCGAARNVTREPEQLRHPFLPQFVDAKIERRYRNAYQEYRVVALKATITAAVLISMVFAALEIIHRCTIRRYHSWTSISSAP